METFKTIATQQLGLLWYIFMVGAMLPRAIPANACGNEVLYQRVVLANYFLIRATIAAAMLLLTVKICIAAAEISAIAAARAAAARDMAFDAKHEATVEAVVSNTSKWRKASLHGMLLFAVRMYVIAVKAATRAAAEHEAATYGRKAFDADHEATAEGLGYIAANWKRVLLRGMLLLAVALSATASFLAIVIFEDWCQDLSGCDAGYGLGSPLSVFLMVATTFVHGFFARVAVCKN